VDRKARAAKVTGFYHVEFDLRLDELHWTDSVAAALAKMPGRFRRAPCTVILPHLEPLAKWISVPPVELHLLRSTVADAMEVDLPIREDEFCWDFLLANSGGGELGGYVFAERRSSAAPIFDLMASEFTYPDRAIIPLMADFSELSRWAKSGTMELQLCIGDTFTTIGFSGGSRPYMRYLSYGWDRLLGETATEGNGLWGAELCEAVKKWLLGQEISADGEADVTGRVEKFLDGLVEEVMKTELQYVHSFGGKHISIARLISAMAQSPRLEKMLSGKLKADVQPFDRSVLVLPFFSHKFNGKVDDLTAMRLLWACGLEMRSPSRRSPFVPDSTLWRRGRERFLQRVSTALAAVIVALAIGLVGLNAKRLLVLREIHEIAVQRSQEEVVFARLREIDCKLAATKAQFHCIDSIRRRQGLWLQIFSDLQGAIIATGGAWLTDFRVPGKVGAPTEVDPATAHISGCLLIGEVNDNAAASVIDRMNGLIQNLRSCDAISEVSDIVFPPQQGQLQPFQCQLTLRTVKF
jgi:hypothetical protein